MYALSAPASRSSAAIRWVLAVVFEYLNPLVISAYALFFGTTFLSILAYRGIPLSLGPVLEATSYIYVTFFGVAIFKEKINKKKIAALMCIFCGILIYSLFG